ncbi:hypothetical protein HQN78_21525 [Chromobacterium sp. Beijing]|nr:hypothetical protein HQN78_21525 [Chromobacterium sp. Beijing]
MPSNPVKWSPGEGAECSFREAFERLKIGVPNLLPKGARVSQNNVAKEAGCSPSALRKSRYPSLIAEIQRWIKDNVSNIPASSRQAKLLQRDRNRSLREKIEALKAERDHALSLLIEADQKILELLLENAALQEKLPELNVTPIRVKK